MFGHASLPSKNWSYGAFKPSPIEAVSQQMKDGHKYRNNLVQVERNRRVKVNEAMNTRFPELARVEEDITRVLGEMDELRHEIKRSNADTRRWTRGTPQQRAQIKQLKA